jgi:aminoglycoside phosphotransferase (APT) family kinase protein
MSSMEELLRSALGDGEITNLRRLSGGASRETWAFEHDGEPLVVQQQRPGLERGGGGMRSEAKLLRAAAVAGVPVARLHYDGTERDDGVRPFFISEAVEGETIARKILRDERWAPVRPKLAAQCGEALAAIHRIPIDAAPELERHDQIEQYRTVLDLSGEPHPAFELGFRWLEANRPPSTRVTVVHGDFRHGNFIVNDSGLAAVLDWELAHLGDPMEDLGWLCVKAWRFGAPLPVGGFGEYDELFAAYGAASGVEVDPDAVHWWEVLGTLKWGVICIMQASAHLGGFSRSVELAAIGRRVCENEYDLLRLLP